MGVGRPSSMDAAKNRCGRPRGAIVQSKANRRRGRQSRTGGFRKQTRLSAMHRWILGRRKRTTVAATTPRGALMPRGVAPHGSIPKDVAYGNLGGWVRAGPRVRLSKVTLGRVRETGSAPNPRGGTLPSPAHHEVPWPLATAEPQSKRSRGPRGWSTRGGQGNRVGPCVPQRDNGPIRGIASAKAGHGAIEGKGHWAGRPARFSKNSKKVIAPIRVIPILCAPVSPKRQNDEFGR